MRLLGWLLLIMTIVLGTLAAGHLIQPGWSVWLQLAVRVALTSGPAAFVGYALAEFGVKLLGGGGA
jgi:hypothetical protein